MKKHLFQIVYYILLIAASVWILMGVFNPAADDILDPDPVIVHLPSKTPMATPAPTHTMAPTDTPLPTKPGDPTHTPTPTATNTPTPTPTNTPTPLPEGAEVIYKVDDEEIKIQVIKYRAYNSTIYVSDIDIAKIDYLKISDPSPITDKNGKTTGYNRYYPEEWAKKTNALLAINGDMFTSGAGYIIRNGVVYRTKKATVEEGLVRQDLVLFADGTHKFINEDEVACEELIGQGAWNLLSFGPVLIDNGEVIYSKSTCNSDKKSLNSSNPRTAIGQTADGHYIFITVDGRDASGKSGIASKGVTFDELVQLGKSIGCVWLYNLDGGQSSQMVFDGKVQNRPLKDYSFKERTLSEIVYIGY